MDGPVGILSEVRHSVAGTAIDIPRELKALGQLCPADQRDIASQWSRRGADRKVKPSTLLGQRRRRERELQLADKIQRISASLGVRQYGVIIADPPWSRQTYSDAGKSRDPANHYPTMTIEELTALELPAADDCVLFLWTTGEHLADSLGLLKPWGFTYKSQMIWRKPKISTGYWVRTQHETVLIATRGKPVAPAPGTQLASVFDAPVRGHSVKPDLVHRMVEDHWPHTPKLEMFARQPRQGWSVWGAEVPEEIDPIFA